MLAKIIIYACTQRIYFSRQIAKAVRQNIMSMWIAGRQRPDFRTINRVNSERMKTALETVFTAVLQFPVVYVCLGEGCLEAECQGSRGN
ncbi:transposase [Paenibacillus ehimensis]|uniref:Transposase n=1 Tax=Paenibacillus ehimensis TaxID=79264 RepID=A0ABT8VC56_9BACL|nr:transposase [Paenibacillus ehimensis]MDO3678570.1 transposase [Paenibacillus ehimensis]